MKEATYYPNNSIYEIDTEINRIYYIIKGTVISYNQKKDIDNNTYFEKFYKGNTFGANNFIGRTLNKKLLISDSVVKLAYIEYDDFINIL